MEHVARKGIGRRSSGAAFAAVAIAALALTACGEDPAAPGASETVEDQLARLDGEVAGLVGGQTELAPDVAAFLGPPDVDRSSLRSRSLLVALTHRALRVVAAEQGREQVRELLAPIFESLRKARRARAAGEFEAAREFLLEARLGMAGIVVRVLGPEVSERVLAGVSERVRVLVARLEAAEAAGGEHARVRALLERVAGLLGESSRALEAGEPALSLDRSTRAADLLHHWLD